MAWLSAEHPVLLAVLRHAADAGSRHPPWQLAWALDTFQVRQGHWRDRAAAWRTARRAAESLGHLAAQAITNRFLADTDTLLGDYASADAGYARALRLYSEADDPTGQGDTLCNLAVLCDRQGDQRRALAHAEEALERYQVAGHRRGQAQALNAIGWYHAMLGDYAEALEYCERALALLIEFGDLYGQAAAWDSLGYVHHHPGQHARAAECYEKAIELCRSVSLTDRYAEADVLTRLGDTQHAAGRRDAARQAWQTALGILTDLHHPQAEQVRAKLDPAELTR